MRPKILVIYYSQSGQLKKIIDSVFSQVLQVVDLTFCEITVQPPFPFPWKAKTFFDSMPESVLEIAPPVSLSNIPDSSSYDLIVLGYQPWFLSPSQPVTGFFNHPKAAEILKGKPVVTIIGSRNMWLNAQEKIKKQLLNKGALLTGNIVFEDKNPNLISVITIIRWAFTGKKESTTFLPAAGVQQKEVEAGSKFGPVILSNLNDISKLHASLLEAGSVNLRPGLVLLEQRGVKNFRFWAGYVRAKGGPGSIERAGRVSQFKYLLIFSIFILSPLSNLSAFIILQLKKSKFKKEVEYFKNISYKENAL